MAEEVTAMNGEFERVRGHGELVERELSHEERDKLLSSRTAAEEFGTRHDLDITEEFRAATRVLGAQSPRTSVDIDVYPCRAIAFLQIDREGAFSIRGTGFFVSKHVIATAAHNLPSDLTSIHVYAKMDGDTSSPPYVTSRCRVNPEYWGDTRADYGVIIISEAVGAATGWFVVPPTPWRPEIGTPTKMSGYPENGGLYQLGGTGPVVNVNSDTLLYGVNTHGGDSGAPVWFDGGGLPLLLGIHRAEDGIATPITQSVSDRLRAWIAEIDP